MESKLYVSLCIADLKRELKVDELQLLEITENLFTNAKRLGITVYEVDLPNETFHGAFRFIGGKPTIYLRLANFNYYQKRFILAYMIGCLYMDSGWSYDCDQFDINYRCIYYSYNIDTRIKCFVFNLLLPRGNFLDEYKNFNGDIKNLSDYFNVNNKVILNRIKDLQIK